MPGFLCQPQSLTCDGLFRIHRCVILTTPVKCSGPCDAIARRHTRFAEDRKFEDSVSPTSLTPQMRPVAYDTFADDGHGGCTLSRPRPSHACGPPRLSSSTGCIEFWLRWIVRKSVRRTRPRLAPCPITFPGHRTAMPEPAGSFDDEGYFRRPVRGACWRVPWMACGLSNEGVVRRRASALRARAGGMPTRHGDWSFVPECLCAKYLVRRKE